MATSKHTDANGKKVAGHIDTKHNFYYMVISLPNPQKGNRKLPKWFPTKIPVNGTKKNERAAEKMLVQWLDDFALGKTTLAMLEDQKAKEQVAPELKRIAITKEIYFTDYLLTWLQVMRGNWEEGTYVSYWSIVHSPILPYFKERNITLGALTSLDITLFYQDCKKRLVHGKPITNNTIKHYHAVVHKSLQDAVVFFRVLEYNPADYLNKPRPDNYVAAYANTEELQELVTDFMNSPIRMPVLLGAFFGMRRSEALGIRKVAIDRRKKTITVSHTVIELYFQGEHKIIRKDRTKTKKSCRTYPLLPQFEAFLEWELAYQEQQRRLMGNCYYMGDQDYICLDATGHLLRPDYVSSKFTELVHKRNLPQISFHGLRHSCASMLYEKGQDMKRIQEWLGHSTPVTTETIYAHLKVDHKNETAQIANDSLKIDVAMPAVPPEHTKKEAHQSA